MDDDLRQAVEFHGHLCPGLAIGYRVAKYIQEHYPRSEDEELVCIAENRSCSVDAVQQILGCTAGKGNLKERREFEVMRSREIERIIMSPDLDLLSVSTVQIPPPRKAEIHPTLGCQECGEGFMEICGRTVNGKVVCLDCFEKLTEREA